VLIRARLENGNLASLGTIPGAGRTYIAIRALSVTNDTHALFRVPPGLRSGLYAVSLKQGTVVSQAYQYAVVLQRVIDETYVESFEPSDLILTDGFHGGLNLTLKAKSPGSHYELPLIRQLADGSVP
jgi:hypothetical protein